MGVYIGNKFIKLRFTKRGTRVGVGPDGSGSAPPRAGMVLTLARGQ